MVKDLIHGFLKDGVPVLGAVGSMLYVYDKKSKPLWMGLAAGAAGWAASQLAVGGVYRLLQGRQALPTDTATLNQKQVTAPTLDEAMNAVQTNASATENVAGTKPSKAARQRNFNDAFGEA